jgi:hypothetical protein
MRSFSFHPRASVLALTVGLCVLASPAADAGWPPPLDATPEDMKNPANWPNDPDYGFDAEEKEDGQWNYFSFIPEPSKARPAETASGMSIDLAWRFTTGHPSVLIGITDSGINWDSDDLIEAAFLNHRELQAHRPKNADDSACDPLDPSSLPIPGDTPEQIAGFDCNGDGILTVADYAATPALEPQASEGVVKGDKNGNGVLDAGDLILQFSDGIDDDDNGYTDDISGWDFFKDDNDPYDDTRYGHGTGEGRDSMARGNNEKGGIGGCNDCRMLALRVGDSFITDVADFGQAVIYATDMRAKVIQSALGTINMSNYAQEALDYAYENGVLTVASMADENARHHNMPTAANHTLPVHAINFTGSSVFTTDSFLNYHPCSNYGGQNLLSASGHGCSSEAVGQLSGISGLLFSAAKKNGIELSPGQAQSLLFMTADDIHVPESHDENSIYKWSDVGFDQRFGYGRVNANSAVEWIEEGRIPPAVDITHPTWFSVLYKDKVEGPVDIVGTVSASGANSYDYIVEWAPGVQPFDEDFVEVARETNIPQSKIMGQDGPLASLDIRNIDPTHEPDTDSPHGENRVAITVRVRATAHYGGEIGDVPGEMRRTYYVHEDPDLAKGFPIFIGDSGESSPKMADIDGDGLRDLVYPSSGGILHVLKLTSSGPEPVAGFPFEAEHIDGIKDPPSPGRPVYDAAAYDGDIDRDLARESLTTSAPAIADLDGDGMNEIVVTSYAGTIYVIEHDGTVRDGWPKRLPEVPSCSLDSDNPTPGKCMGNPEGNKDGVKVGYARGAFAAPVLEDMDQDGDLDIIQAAFDGLVYVFDLDGNDVDGWPVLVKYEGSLSDEPAPGRVFTTPAVGDFNDDGYPEILVGSNEKLGSGENSGASYLLDGRGTNAPAKTLPNWPVTMTSLQLFPLVAEGVTNSGVIGRMQGGVLAAIQHGNASLPLIMPADPGPQAQLNETPPNVFPQRPDPSVEGQIRKGVDPSSEFGKESKAKQPNTMLPLFSQPALGDMDQDGVPDIISSGGSLDVAIALQSSTGQAGDNLLSMWSGETGAMLPASPMVLEDFTFFNSSAIADLTGDGYPEAIIGSGGYYLHAFDACGREPEGWPKFTGQWIITTPALGDMDGDGTLEVAIGTRNGWMYVWHTRASVNNVIEWESYHHDNRNTGNIEVELEQGGPSTAASPLVDATCRPPAPPPEYVVAGGCACRAPAAAAPLPRGFMLFGIAGFLAFVARAGLRLRGRRLRGRRLRGRQLRRRRP